MSLGSEGGIFMSNIFLNGIKDDLRLINSMHSDVSRLKGSFIGRIHVNITSKNVSTHM